MSIETLLEAAKFLELQAQQQQKAREDEFKEKQRLEQLAEQKNSCVYYKLSANHVSHVPQRRGAPHQYHPAPPSPSSMPITVIPIPVVTPSPTGSSPLPVASLSPPAAPLPPAATLPHSPQPPPEQAISALTPDPQQLIPNQPPHPQLITQTAGASLQELAHQPPLQRYPGSIVSPHQQTLLPQTGPPLQQASLQNVPISRGSPTDDSRHPDLKKRPGGAGTREVHNKLEKNRRAHLKECFETLKKNIPNIEEKKTSNLSVLRSALRYIQTLKRKEKEYEHDMERLAREKIATQQHLAELKNDLSQWMEVMEIERLLRQTVQPEEDQASTSTASEGEDMEEDLEEEPAARPKIALPTVPPPVQPELQSAAPALALAPAPAPNPPPASTTSIVTQHVSISTKAPPRQPHLHPALHIQPAPKAAPKAPTLPATPVTPAQPPLPTPTPTQVATVPSIHPTVIAHASVSHPSVIQAVNHVIQGGPPKRIAHLAPSPTTTTTATSATAVQLPAAHQSIGHITVHPVAHLSQHLPALYPQPVAVPQPAVVGHIAHTLNHSLTHAHPQMNGATPVQQAAAIIGKQTAMSAQMVAHHPQLMGPTVLNPVTMVTMPSFPISTLKLA